MNYKIIYDAIIAFRKSNIPSGYSEKHHILPRALGGDNSKNNIVRLTAKEHFICHRLLAKIHGGKMWAALAYMMRGNTKSAKGVRVTSRQCIHCGKVGNIANMHRWHFDNCKLKAA